MVTSTKQKIITMGIIVIVTTTSSLILFALSKNAANKKSLYLKKKLKK